MREILESVFTIINICRRKTETLIIELYPNCYIMFAIDIFGVFTQVCLPQKHRKIFYY